MRSGRRWSTAIATTSRSLCGDSDRLQAAAAVGAAPEAVHAQHVDLSSRRRRAAGGARERRGSFPGPCADPAPECGARRPATIVARRVDDSVPLARRAGVARRRPVPACDPRSPSSRRRGRSPAHAPPLMNAPPPAPGTDGRWQRPRRVLGHEHLEARVRRRGEHEHPLRPAERRGALDGAREDVAVHRDPLLVAADPPGAELGRRQQTRRAVVLERVDLQWRAERPDVRERAAGVATDCHPLVPVDVDETAGVDRQATCAPDRREPAQVTPPSSLRTTRSAAHRVHPPRVGRVERRAERAPAATTGRRRWKCAPASVLSSQPPFASSSMRSPVASITVRPVRVRPI